MSTTTARIHVFPVDDELPHTDSVDCLCGPVPRHIDPRTGHPYPEPVFLHRRRWCDHRHRDGCDDPVVGTG